MIETERQKKSQLALPCAYKEFYLVRSHGRVYGIPHFLEPEELIRHGKHVSHPAVLSAATCDELQAQIDDFDYASIVPETVGSYRGYNLVRFRGTYHGVLQSVNDVDLDLAEDRRRGSVVSGETCEKVQQHIDAALEAAPVEFAGWLPIFAWSGNCGTHPQFTHTGQPPTGYRFTCSAPPRKRWLSPLAKVADSLTRAVCSFGRALWSGMRPVVGLFLAGSTFAPRARLRIGGAMIRQAITLWRDGARILPILRFLQSRHFHSQMLLSPYRGLVFLTSMPYTYGQNPWIVEIEDPTTLFYPLIQNGHTNCMNLADSPYFPIIRSLLESEQCKGILTHMKSTAELVPTLFGSDIIRSKVRYSPLGVRLPERWQRHDEENVDAPIDLLFINSWCQIPENFYVRGGLDILEAYDIIRRRYPNVRLTLRTSLPPLDDHFHRIIEEGWVRIFNRFLPADELAALHADSHIFLLPAARVHIVSLLQAMSYGLAVVTSDGWGIEEYINHQRNGLIVKGRYGKVSWADYEAGMLRENYEPMQTADPEVVQGLVEAISRLVEDRLLRRRLGWAARQDVRVHYNLERWNNGLKQAFDCAKR